MCLGTFSRLRRSLATSTLYAAVRILAERFLLYREAISCKVKKAFVPVTGRRLHYHRYTTSYNVRALHRYTFPLTAEQPASPTARRFQSATQE